MGGSFGILTSHPDLLGCQLLRLDGQVQLGSSAHSTTLVGLGTISAGEALLRRWASRVAPRTLADPELAAATERSLRRTRTVPSLPETGRGSWAAWPGCSPSARRPRAPCVRRACS